MAQYQWTFSDPATGATLSVTVDTDANTYTVVNTGTVAFDLNAIWFSDADKTSGEGGITLLKSDSSLNLNGTGVVWDDYLKLSSTGLGSEGTAKTTYLTGGESLEGALGDGFGWVKDWSALTLGVRATSVGVSGTGFKLVDSTGSEVSADTTPPTVTSVSASDALITDADTGTGTFSVTVDFSEAMNGTASPTLTFSPEVASTLTFASGNWTDSDTYVATYNVADGNVDVDNVSIDVTGAQDAAGNAQQDYTPANEFGIDQLNPTVTSVSASDALITDADTGTGTFSVTVDFSEAMNGTASPTLTFSPEVASTLTFASGNWTDSDTYVATYNVADGNVDVDNVSIDVTGAQDAAGNAQQDYTPANEFGIDQLNPTVTSVSASDALITDADTGTGTFSVTVDFSEAMNGTASPTLTFSPEVASTLTFASGTWTDSDTYVATYNVADGNVDVDNVSIDVTGAQDAAGNAQQDYTPANEFGIDQLNPTVTSVSASDALITDADTGTGTFSVTVDFSEAMNGTASPTLTFSPEVASTLTFASGNWTDSDTYVATYNVADGNVDVDNVSIDVTGAQDAAGNAQQDYTPANEFGIDQLNPTVTSVSASDALITDADTGTGTFSVTVDFSEAMNGTASPTLTFSPEVASTLTFASGTWTDSDTYVATYNVADGNVDVDNVSIDVTGAQDAAGNAQQDYTPANEFGIDQLKPTVTSVSASDALITDADTGTGTFSVTVDFSEAMNGTASPTLTFSPEVASTLTFASGNWTDSDTYVATYNVADGNVDVDNVSIDVTGAQDAAGNAQQDYTPANEFGIDQLNPTVTSVSASDALITDADTGTGTFSVTVDFSEAMNGTASPTLTFSPEVASTLTFASGTWTDSDTYVATYNVADGNVDVDNVSIDVTGAQDAAGNAQQDYTPANEFGIDQLNPTVTSVSASDALITDADTGTGTFSVTVDFSEAMNGTASPTLTFSPEVASTLTFASGTWTDSDTYVATYNVADGNVDVDNVSIDVTGAQDAAGNAQQDYTPANEFGIDQLNPTVAISFSPETVSGQVYTSTITFQFSETVSGFTAGDVTLTNGVLTNFAGSGSSYTATFTATNFDSPTGTVAVTNGYFDAVGNQGIANLADINMSIGADPNDGPSGTISVTGITLSGSGSTDDSFTGTTANDNLSGGNGNDTLYGGDGNDTINGGNQADLLYGGSGNDGGIAGGNDEDVIYGGSGNDIINGGNGNDTITGGYGNDSLTGGGNNDTFRFLSIYDETDSITDFGTGGSTGTDTIVFDTTGSATQFAFTSLAGKTYTQAITDGFLVFNGTTDTLSYDHDGAGTAWSAIAIVTVTGATSTPTSPTFTDTNVLFQGI